MDEKLSDLLIRSFDEELTFEEQVRLDNVLKNSEELRSEKKQLLLMRELIGNNKNSFGPNFSSEVMARINESGFSSGIFPLFKKIAFAGAASIIILLGLHVWSGGSLSLESILGVESAAQDVVTFNVMGH